MAKKQFLKDWPTELAFSKGGVKYYRDEFGTLHSKSIDQTDMVGGENHFERNIREFNEVRLQRIKDITGKSNPYVLDYGCGQGQFLYFLREKQIKSNGYDPYNPEFNYLFNIKYDCITMIEVVEHLSYPFPELSGVHLLLNEGGKVMIEASFTDWLTQDDEYINPEVGHCTIFSHAGLDCFMQKAGFKIASHINQNVRVYEK